MVDLVYRPATLADLDAIYDFIEPDSPRQAARFVQDIRVKCRLLCENPRLGPARDNIKAGTFAYTRCSAGWSFAIALPKAPSSW